MYQPSFSSDLQVVLILMGGDINSEVGRHESSVQTGGSHIPKKLLGKPPEASPSLNEPFKTCGQRPCNSIGGNDIDILLPVTGTFTNTTWNSDAMRRSSTASIMRDINGLGSTRGEAGTERCAVLTGSLKSVFMTSGSLLSDLESINVAYCPRIDKEECFGIPIFPRWWERNTQRHSAVQLWSSYQDLDSPLNDPDELLEKIQNSRQAVHFKTLVLWRNFQLVDDETEGQTTSKGATNTMASDYLVPWQLQLKARDYDAPADTVICVLAHSFDPCSSRTWSASEIHVEAEYIGMPHRPPNSVGLACSLSLDITIGLSYVLGFCFGPRPPYWRSLPRIHYAAVHAAYSVKPCGPPARRRATSAQLPADSNHQELRYSLPPRPSSRPHDGDVFVTCSFVRLEWIGLVIAGVLYQFHPLWSIFALQYLCFWAYHYNAHVRDSRPENTIYMATVNFQFKQFMMSGVNPIQDSFLHDHTE
ncbi:hypothetical protein ARMGADRAFT_1030093 [Armillaria gallica]|uniref:Uncharacterized protein n=1 Tax=Armillaria gallica TaxID=47427 RepID=A0A2H3DH64_ARMGA|nr:hypothetical protein ARMGADRAFT_1030093 [Armillaria gallica]